MSDGVEQNRDEASKWRLPKWGWALLAGSLALNLLVVGSIIGMRMSGHHHARGGHGMKELVRGLPANKRDEVRQILRKHRKVVRPLRRALRTEARELADYARSDVMDVAEFERRLTELGVKRADMRKRLEPMMVELARTLGPEARGKILARLLRTDRRRRHRRHRRHKD